MKVPEQPKLRLKDKRRRLMWVKVIAGSSVVALSFVLVWYVAHLPALTIASVEVSGTKVLSAESVKAFSEAALQGSYVYIIPHRNILVVPKKQIEETLKNKFPEIRHLTISEKNLTTLSIVIDERVSVALWCRVEDECYKMDIDGFIFAHASKEDTSVRFFGLLPGVPVGAKFLDDFGALNKLVVDISASASRTPESLVIPEGTHDAFLTFTDGGVVRFIGTGEAPSDFSNIASVFASQSFKTKRSFEYVDFRFGDKVLVQFK